MNQNSKNNENTWFLVLLIVSLLTLGVHTYLSLQHYQLKLGLAEGKSICNLNATFNCDTVAISKYAALFGIPMALMGLLSQVVFMVLLVTTRFELSANSPVLRRLLFWISAFIFVTSIVMGSISSLALGTYCLFCISAYVLSIFQLVGAWKYQETSPFAEFGSDLAALFSQARWALILLILIPALGWMLNAMILDSYGFGRINIVIQESIASWESAPTETFQEDRGLVLKHDSEPAKVTVVEFADFLCPHCKAASPTMETFAQGHKDVKLIFKTFPLDGKCNKAIQHEGDGLRCRLSAAVMCAQKIGQKGWDAHHWVFERQEELARGSITAQAMPEELSKNLGLDSKALVDCMNSDATNDEILAMAQEGSKIAGTPTIYVNGKMLDRGQALPVLEALYQKLH